MSEWKDFKKGTHVLFRSMYDQPWEHGVVVRKDWHGKIDATTNITIRWDNGRETNILTCLYWMRQGLLKVDDRG